MATTRPGRLSTGEMTGTIRARDKIYNIKELTEEKFVKKSGEHFNLALKHDDFAKLSIGNVNFFILYVKPAPRIRPAPFFERDPLLMRTAIGSHDVLRVKGFIDVPDRDRRLVVQAVGARLQRHFDRPWHPGENRQTRLVVIGRRGLDRAAITAELGG